MREQRVSKRMRERKEKVARVVERGEREGDIPKGCVGLDRYRGDEGCDHDLRGLMRNSRRVGPAEISVCVCING